ncbi:hypothetical protein [Motilimonas sp. KMU-193]|uniref:Dph6-related ATP pyrophosphatase n=1 Tax=Motilimonas sp. KMU-193 TaxID=3388668 RepID=UPI00396B3D2F
MKKVIISWSSGKDSALTLLKMLQSDHYQVVGLFTTYSAEKSLVPIQATPIQFVRLQAEAIGLPLLEIPMDKGVSNNQYQQTLIAALEAWPLDFDAIAFGDIYNNGIADFRKKVFQDTSIECVFPLLKDRVGKQSRDIADQIIQSGIKAMLQSINLRHLDNQYCGAIYSPELLDRLPKQVDPCGEGGEFHTFVFDAPFFKHKIMLEPLDQEHQHYHHGSDMNMLVQRFNAQLA